MINGNANEFISKLHYEDHFVIFNKQKYYLNGCQCEIDSQGNVKSVSMEVYNLTLDSTVFSCTKRSGSECISEFESAKIWNSKTFWEAECDIEWVND